MSKKKRTDDKIKDMKTKKDAELEQKIIEMMKPEKKPAKKGLKVPQIKASNITFAKKGDKTMMSPEPSVKKFKNTVES